MDYKLPDYYLIDDLLTEEHKIVRQSVRDWVDQSRNDDYGRWITE